MPANQSIDEESSTSGVAGYQTPFAFGRKKKQKYVEEDNERYMKGKTVNRGEIKLGPIDKQAADKIANDNWDIFGSQPGENGTWHYKTRGDAFCCTIGTYNGQPAMLEKIPGDVFALKLLVGDELKNDIQEQSSTSGVDGYSTPYAFSKNKEGSKKATDVTKKLGFKVVGPAPRV